MFSGEEYKVWRWLPQGSMSPGPPLNTSAAVASSFVDPVTPEQPQKCSNGRVWQGQAFEKNAAKYSPTPCLKIRNMFTSDRYDCETRTKTIFINLS